MNEQKHCNVMNYMAKNKTAMCVMCVVCMLYVCICMCCVCICVVLCAHIVVCV